MKERADEFMYNVNVEVFSKSQQSIHLPFKTITIAPGGRKSSSETWRTLKNL